MTVKPFKPLTLARSSPSVANLDGAADSPPPRKKRRVVEDDNIEETPKTSASVKPFKPASSFVPHRPVLAAVQNGSQPPTTDATGVEAFYKVLW